jgi:hypothetical protein
MKYLKKTAILVDGGFYRRRAQTLWGEKTAENRADELFTYCMKHLNHKLEDRELYRIFYYDCPPAEKRVYHPLQDKTVNLKTSELHDWSEIFLNELRSKRKVALRLGELAESQAGYLLTVNSVKKLCQGLKQVADLEETDFFLDIKQKGVDMRIGLDIASMAYKRQVDQIILISGDSDFVPAAKLARREGIDFILDPMQSNIRANLNEHIDGIDSRVNFMPQPRAIHTDSSIGEMIALPEDVEKLNY